MTVKGRTAEKEKKKKKERWEKSREKPRRRNGNEAAREKEVGKPCYDSLEASSYRLWIRPQDKEKLEKKEHWFVSYN